MHFKTIDNLITAPFEDLISAEEIGERIALSIKEYFDNPKHIATD